MKTNLKFDSTQDENVDFLVTDKEMDLSDADRAVLEQIDHHNSHKTFTHLDLDACAEELLKRMINSPTEEIEVFGLNNQQLDAAGILTQSGEATLYRNDKGQLCITPTVMFKRFFQGW